MPVPTYIVKEAIQQLERGSVYRARTLLEEALLNEVDGLFYVVDLQGQRCFKTQGWKKAHLLHRSLRYGNRVWNELRHAAHSYEPPRYVHQYRILTPDGETLTFGEFLRRYPPKSPVDEYWSNDE